LIPLDDMLVRITQNDVVHRRYLDRKHRSYVPDFGVYMRADIGDGKVRTITLSRQMVLFCVERRKSWRLLQSKAGIENLEYKAQRLLLGRVDSGEVPLEDFLSHSAEMLEKCLAELKKPAKKPEKVPVASR